MGFHAKFLAQQFKNKTAVAPTATKPPARPTGFKRALAVKKGM